MNWDQIGKRLMETVKAVDIDQLLLERPKCGMADGDADGPTVECVGLTVALYAAMCSKGHFRGVMICANHARTVDGLGHIGYPMMCIECNRITAFSISCSAEDECPLRDTHHPKEEGNSPCS